MIAVTHIGIRAMALNVTNTHAYEMKL